MNPLLSLGLRNVRRQTGRTLLTSGAAAFGLFLATLVGGAVLAIGQALIEDAVEGRVGSIQIHRPGWRKPGQRSPLALHFEGPEALVARIAAVPGVQAVAPRIDFVGLASNGRSQTLFMGEGVEQEAEQRVLPRAERAVHGHSLDSAHVEAGQVGSTLARAMGVADGGSITLQSQTLVGRENALDLEVVGTIADPSVLEGQRRVRTTLAHAQRLLGMEGKVTAFVISVADRDQVDTVASALRATLGDGFEVEAWHQLRPQLRDIQKIQLAVMGLAVFIFLALVVFGVANTTAMSVFERTREIGTMLALGVRRSRIGALILIEAGLQAGGGALLGHGLGVLLLFAIRAAGGISISPPGGDLPLTLSPSVPTSTGLLVVGMTTLAALLAALGPALRASRLRPVEALAGR